MANILPRETPENLTVPELEKWLTAYSQEIFPSPTINFGGSVRRVQALRECLKVAFKLQTGQLETLVFVIMRTLGVNKAKAASDYIETLVDFEVIRKHSPTWDYIGKKPT